MGPGGLAVVLLNSDCCNDTLRWVTGKTGHVLGKSFGTYVIRVGEPFTFEQFTAGKLLHNSRANPRRHKITKDD